MEEAAQNGDEFLYAGLNQDNGCFAVGCHNGFRVFNCEPFTEQVRPVSTTFALTACTHASITVLFSICTGYGYAARARRAQNADASPFGLQFRRVFSNPVGGIKIVEMLFRCNILALVGGGPTPRYPSNKVRASPATRLHGLLPRSFMLTKPETDISVAVFRS